MKKTFILIFSALMLITGNLLSQVMTEVYASGLTHPIGLTFDGAGNLWVAEQGTGNDDSRVAIVTPSGMVHPFLINLPSEIVQGDPIGAEHTQFDIDGKLLIVQGEGADTLSESILVVDPTGFTPGDPPLTISDIEAVFNIGDYAISQGGATSNPYRLVLGPNDDWYISDAGFNGVIKRDRATGNLSVFTQLGPVVSTGLVYTGTNFYLGSLTGFPFPTGGAKVYQVDLNGNNSVFQDQLTTIVDVAIDPLDHKLLALQYAEFSGGFQNNSGALFVITSTSVDTLLEGLNFPTGMVFNQSGELFISLFADGEILKVTGIPVSVEDITTSIPETFVLNQNYPNPFNPSTKISYVIKEANYVELTIYDVLGKKVKTLVNNFQKANMYTVNFDAYEFANGIYYYKLKVGNAFEKTRKMLYLK